MRLKLFAFLFALMLPLSGLFAHGVQLRWNIVPSTGAIRVWVEHWHGATTNVSGYPLVVTYTVGGSTTTQTYLANGYVNGTSVSNLPGGGNSSTLLSSCGDANYYNNWVYWDFNPPACNTPVSLTIVEGTQVTTTEGCYNLYPQTIYSNFNDNSGPALTCNNITVAPSGANCDAVVSNYGVTAIDACGGSSSVSYSIPEGSAFAMGTTTVTATATDQSGNISTCTFNVTVADNQAPTVVTQDISVNLANGSATITAADVDNGSFDGNTCGGIAGMTVSPNTFDCNDEGANTVTLTVTDNSGNVSTGTAIVTVNSDLQVSVASVNNASCYGSCDGSVNLNITGGTAPYTLVGDDFSHGFDGTSINNSLFTHNGVFSQNNTLSWGYTSTNWQERFITTSTFNREAGKTFSFKYYTASNEDAMLGWYGVNSANATYQYQNLVHGVYFYNSYLYIYEDGNYRTYLGNLSANTWYTLKIELKASGADYYIDYNNSGNYSLVYSSNNSAESNLAVGITPYGPRNGNGQTDDWKVNDGSSGITSTSNLCAGSYNVMVVDANGCKKPVSFTITEPSAPLTSSLNAAGSTCALQTYTVSAGNTTGGTAPYSYSYNMGDGSTLTGSSATHSYSIAGTYTVTLTVMDANGCSVQYITNVQAISCNAPPVAACQNITLNADANCSASIVATDIDGGSTDPDGDVLTYTVDNSGPFGIGSHTVTLTVSDGEFSENCIATVTVVDVTAPVLTCPANITVNSDPGLCGAKVEFKTMLAHYDPTGYQTGSTSTSLSGVYPGVSASSLSSPGYSSNYNYDVRPVGPISNSLNTNQYVEFTINSAPTANLMTVEYHKNSYFNAGPNSAAIRSSANGYTTDISSIAVNPAGRELLEFDVSSMGSVSYPLTLRIYFWGGNGDWADIISSTYGGQGVKIYGKIIASSTDNCGSTITYSGLDANDFYPVGTTTITATATDASGNSSSCNFDIVVSDNEAPTAITQNITVQLDANGQASITEADIDNGSNDACGIASLSLDNHNFDCDDTGANTVTLTVTDNNGNVSTQTATVTVEDNIDPVISGTPSNISVIAQPNDCTPSIPWTAPTASDNCTVSLTSSHNPGDNFAVGTTTVTYTATDASGNSVSTSFTVTVTPTPLVSTISAATYAGGYNISCNGFSDGSIDLSISGGCLPYTYSWSNGATSEDISSLTAGTYNVDITDANGTTISESITLTEPATLTVSGSSSGYLSGSGVTGTTLYIGYGPQSINLNATASGGVGPYSYSWSPAASLSGANTDSPVASPLQTTTYTVTATDQNGCTATFDVTVDVIDATCGNNNQNKVYVCHRTGNAKKGYSYHNICISVNAVQTHLNHGDYLGPCMTSSKMAEERDDLDELHYHIYPNPTTGITNIELEMDTESDINIMIFDMTGKLLQHISETAVEGHTGYQVDMSTYAKGVYLVKIQSGEKVQTERLIKE